MTTTLAWGLADAVPADSPAAWGARLIITMDGHVDFVPDRMDAAGEPEARRAFLDLLGERFPSSALRARIVDGLDRREFTTRTSDTVILYVDDDVTVVANPRGSAGYLYVAAFPTVRPDALLASWARRRAEVADADGRVPPGWEPTGTRHNPHWANND